MRHQAKTQGFWGWVVLGLCALAVLAGAYQSTRAKSTKDPQALETPNIIADQTDPKGDDAEEVSVPVTIPVLPEKPEVPVSGETEEPAEPVIASAPRIIVPPLTGETVAAFSADALQYNDTLADWRTHDGIDIKAAEGTPVKSVNDGKILDIREDAQWGITIEAEYPDGITVLYCGLSSDVKVKKGQEVKMGDVLGSVGASGLIESSEESHLHLAMKQDSQWIDPMSRIVTG